jgi:hypothetical protein
MVDTGIVTVIERIPLRTEFATPEGALLAGQAYDDIAGPNAHRQPGHAGHASFFFEPQSVTNSGTLILIYPWYGQSALIGLLNSEATILDQWLTTYAAGPREVIVLSELPVDTGHSHERSD